MQRRARRRPTFNILPSGDKLGSARLSRPARKPLARIARILYLSHARPLNFGVGRRRHCNRLRASRSGTYDAHLTGAARNKHARAARAALSIIVVAASMPLYLSASNIRRKGARNKHTTLHMLLAGFPFLRPSLLLRSLLYEYAARGFTCFALLGLPAP